MKLFCIFTGVAERQTYTCEKCHKTKQTHINTSKIGKLKITSVIREYYQYVG